MYVRPLHIIALAAALSTAPSISAANNALQSVAAVEDGLFAVSVADKIRRECDSLSGRFFKARRTLKDLHDTARAEGFSDADIDAYVNSDAQKSRMRAKRDAYLAAQGVVKSAPATYCAAGQAEIRKSSQIGALLRAR